MKSITKFGTLGALSLVAILSAARSADAQNPCGSYWGWGYGSYPGYGYSSVNNEYVPYFALHPPVYYSQPVPRTYGYSPFAYPPGTMTPEVVAPAPAEIINPYVPQTPKKEKPAAVKGVATKSKVVVNPYVSGESNVAAHDAAE